MRSTASYAGPDINSFHRSRTISVSEGVAYWLTLYPKGRLYFPRCQRDAEKGVFSAAGKILRKQLRLMAKEHDAAGRQELKAKL